MKGFSISKHEHATSTLFNAARDFCHLPESPEHTDKQPRQRRRQQLDTAHTAKSGSEARHCKSAPAGMGRKMPRVRIHAKSWIARGGRAKAKERRGKEYEYTYKAGRFFSECIIKASQIEYRTPYPRIPSRSTIHAFNGPENETPMKLAVLTRLFSSAVHLKRAVKDVPNAGYTYCGPAMLATSTAVMNDKDNVRRVGLCNMTEWGGWREMEGRKGERMEREKLFSCPFFADGSKRWSSPARTQKEKETSKQIGGGTKKDVIPFSTCDAKINIAFVFYTGAPIGTRHCKSYTHRP